MMNWQTNIVPIMAPEEGVISPYLHQEQRAFQETGQFKEKAKHSTK